MMHRSQKLLGDGKQEYFNEKRPVNSRVNGTACLALPAPQGMLTNPGQQRGSVRAVSHSEVPFELDHPHSKLEHCGEILPSPVPGCSAFER
jgi:hypothetical protein